MIMDKTKLQKTTEIITSIANDIKEHTEYIVLESEVVAVLKDDLDNIVDSDFADFGEIFGYSVGMIRTSTYQAILEMIIEDKGNQITELCVELNRIKVQMVKTISGVTEEPKAVITDTISM